MVLQAASIIFNDNCSRFNKDLIDFLKRNIEIAIRKGGVTFQFKIAQTADLAGLRRKGIKALPAMVIADQNFVGVPDIVAELRKRVKNSTGEVATKSEDEIVNDYQMHELYNNVKKDAEGKLTAEPDDETNDGENLMAEFNKEIKKRGASAGHGDQDDNENQTRTRARKPSRAAEQDGDFELEQDEPTQRRPANRQRPDNLEADRMEDAFASLKKISKGSKGEEATDDVMMAALLERIAD